MKGKKSGQPTPRYSKNEVPLVHNNPLFQTTTAVHVNPLFEPRAVVIPSSTGTNTYQQPQYSQSDCAHTQHHEEEPDEQMKDETLTWYSVMDMKVEVKVEDEDQDQDTAADSRVHKFFSFGLAHFSVLFSFSPLFLLLVFMDYLLWKSINGE